MTAALCFAATAVPGLAKADGLHFAIYSGTEHTCLDVKDYSTASGAIVQTYPCTGSTNQSWVAEVFSYDADGSMSMHLTNVNSNLCLDLAFASTNAGVGLVQQPCNGSATQTWKLAVPVATLDTNVYSPQIYRNLINYASGLCPRANGGGQVTQEACGDKRITTATTWRMPLF